MPTDCKRIQKRTPATVALQITSAKQPFITELAFTENVSLHGVRVVTERAWKPGEFTVIVWRKHDMPLVWSYIRRWARGWTFRSHKHQGRKRSPTLPVCHLPQVVAAIFAPSRSLSRARSRASALRSFGVPRSLGLKCGRGRRRDSTPVRRVLSRSLIQFLDKANTAHCYSTCPHGRTISKNCPLNCQIT